LKGKLNGQKEEAWYGTEGERLVGARGGSVSAKGEKTGGSSRRGDCRRKNENLPANRKKNSEKHKTKLSNLTTRTEKMASPG